MTMLMIVVSKFLKDECEGCGDLIYTILIAVASHSASAAEVDADVDNEVVDVEEDDVL